MATADSVKAKIQSLISKANAKTGRSDADMTNAVNALVSGYNPNGITPSGTINITSNGTHDVKKYASANVNVPTGITPTGTINITSNGTHNVTNYATANVNVPVGEDVTSETNTYTSLLADLEDAVNSLPEGGSGGSVETCTVTITFAGDLAGYGEFGNAWFDYLKVTANGIEYETVDINSDVTTVNDVVKGGTILFYMEDDYSIFGGLTCQNIELKRNIASIFSSLKTLLMFQTTGSNATIKLG